MFPSEVGFATNIRPPTVQGRTVEAKDYKLAGLPFNKTHVSGARTFLGFLDYELDALAFPQQFEHRAPDGTAMKEVLEAGFITDEPEAFVD